MSVAARVLTIVRRAGGRRASSGVLLLSGLTTLGLLAGCSGGPAGGDNPPSGASSEPGVEVLDWSGLSDGTDVEPARADDAVLAKARWLEGYRIPRRIPERPEALPKLLDDLPGQAVLTAYSESQFEGGYYDNEWDREVIYFYGVDGRWRALNMADLGIEKAAAFGTDNYGAGSLSPNGRLWATKSKRGSIVVDLATGELRRGFMPEDDNALLYQWTSDSKRLHVTGTRLGAWTSAPDFSVLKQADRGPLVFDGGYLEHPDPAEPPATYRFFSNDGKLEKAIVLDESVLGPTFVFREGAATYRWPGRLMGVSPEGELGILITKQFPYGRKKVNTGYEFRVIDGDSGAVKSRLVLDNVVVREHFDEHLWVLETETTVRPAGDADPRDRTYTGERFVWDSESGQIRKLIDMTSRTVYHRVYDFSYAGELIRE